MKRKTSITILLILTISLFLPALMNQAKATSYYNWVLNPSFDDVSGNYWANNNPSFETGDKTYWDSYGGFSTVTTDEAHTGIYSIHFDGAGTGVSQDVSNVSTNIITVVSGYFKSDAGGNDYAIKATYNDTSYDVVHAALIGEWELKQLSLDSDKFLQKVEFYQHTGSGYDDMWFDDAYLTMDGEGQTTVTDETLPWYRAIEGDFTGIAIGTYHTGVASYYTGYTDANLVTVQDFNYLDSDTVENVSLWAYTTATDDITVRVGIIYSDRSSAYQDNYVKDTDGWIQLEYDNVILPNKLIIQMQVSAPNGADENYVGVDDVYIYSSLPVGSSRFTWELSPEPTSRTNITFTQYQKVASVFTGYLWNSGNNDENGTFTYITSYGTGSGVISNGVFSFPLSERESIRDITESIIITCVTDESETDDIFTINIQAEWIYVGTVYDEDDSEERANNMVDWIIMFVVIFLPALLFAGGLYENNQQPDSMHISPIFGIIAGLALSIGLGIYTNLVPLWLLILMIVAIIVLVFGMVTNR